MDKFNIALLTGFFLISFDRLAIATDSADINNVCHRSSDPALFSASNLEDDLKGDRIFNNTPSSSQKSQPEMTQASFWWAAEQFDPFNGGLVQNWLTYPQLQQVNLVVNWQLWTLLDYFGRYRFVNQFGTVARKYGYNLNILNQKDRCLATYKYNPMSNPPKWELKLEKLGRDSLPIEP